MSSPLMAVSVQFLRRSLFANGFRFVPVATADKKPYPGNSWPERARSLTSEAVATHYPDGEALNTGVLADGLIPIDVDTENSELAEWIVNLAQLELGQAPIRYRSNSPKCLMLYSCTQESIRSLNVVDANGKKILETLGQGRQFVAYGIHPTKVPYLWSEELAGKQRSSLTPVSPEQLSGFLSKVSRHVDGNVSSNKQQSYIAPSASPIQVSPLTTTEDEERIADSVLNKLCEQLRVMGDGEGRNSALNNAALQMGELCAGWGIDQEATKAALLEASIANGYVGKDGLAAARATLESGFAKGLSQPRPRHDPLPDIDISGIPNPLLASTESPRPLRRAIADAHAFPIEALGPFTWPVYAISDKIQCPPAIAALSVLGVASLAAQAHADVLLPRTGQARPLSLYLVSIGESGERKSAADSEASRAIAEYERELAVAFESESNLYRNARDVWESERQNILRSKSMDVALKNNAINALIEPEAPLTPMLTCPEPTFEGLCKLYLTGRPAIGLFSDEGGHFVGGHAMSEDARLRTAAGLSSLWDGAPIKRVRAAMGESYVLPGRRLAMHLMLQPKIASELLSDPILKDQGLLSRMLVSYPKSTAGTRFGKEANPHTQAALDGFTRVIGLMLRCKPVTTVSKRNELTPRHLQFDKASHSLWCEFADKVEAELGPYGKYEAIKGLANKLPEHAARIAGVMTIFENFYETQITTVNLERGIKLVEHFAAEALRLFDAGVVRPEIALAESLLDWLTKRWSEPYVSLRVIQRTGPNAIRDAKTARQAIAILEEHGWLHKAPKETVVDGMPVREAWKIIRE
jgi:hypothetical protein